MNYRLFRASFFIVVMLFGACIRVSTGKLNLDVVPKSEKELAFEAKMQLFTTNESMALEIFNLPDTTSKETMLYEIKERGIYYWNENLKVIDELEGLDLPTDLKQRIPKLREYCNLRIKHYQFYYSIFEKDEKPAHHQQEMKKFGEELDKLMAQLK